MAGLTLADAQANLDVANAELKKAMKSSSYSVPGRSMSRASLGELQASVTFWNGEVKRLSRGGGIPVRGVEFL